jgi:hypothetical protein
MFGGVPVDRQYVLVLNNGLLVIDWGGNLFQDVQGGGFLECKEMEISHRALDSDLETLKRMGLVGAYDTRCVYFPNLPDRPLRTIA